jgi:hypothetical protein
MSTVEHMGFKVCKTCNKWAGGGPSVHQEDYCMGHDAPDDDGSCGSCGNCSKCYAANGPQREAEEVQRKRENAESIRRNRREDERSR